MPRGYPDYQSSRQPAIALQTVWEDDFEAPNLKWARANNLSGTLPVLSSAGSWMGNQSLYLSTDAPLASYSFIQRFFPLLRRGKMGAEFWCWAESAGDGYVQLLLYIYDGATPTLAAFVFDPFARTIEINTPDGWVPVATGIYTASADKHFLPIKLVVDMDTDMYVRLLVGPDELNLSAHALVPQIESTDKYIYAAIYAREATLGLLEAYIDNFILTQNEP